MRLETFLKYLDDSVPITVVDWSNCQENQTTLIEPQYLGGLQYDHYRDICYYFIISARIRNAILEIAVTEYGKE